MSLRLRLWKGALPAFLVWACAKANDSDLVQGPVPNAGVGGSSATGGKGSASGGKSGAGTGGTGAGKAGTGGTSAGTGGQGRAGAPACGERTDDAALVVQYLVSNTQDSSDQIFFHLYFENKSDEALDLARVEVRYWMTAETDAMNAPVTDYRGPQVSGERATFVEDGEFSHLSITFTGNEVPAMNSDLNPTEVQFRIQTQNGAKLDQGDDYSFVPTSMTKAPNDHVTAYVDGKLAWGREPSGLCPTPGEGGQGGQGGEGGEPASAGQGGEGGA
jgi:xyloglucan-specific exo-beta-1,4-glucanase